MSVTVKLDETVKWYTLNGKDEISNTYFVSDRFGLCRETGDLLDSDGMVLGEDGDEDEEILVGIVLEIIYATPLSFKKGE